MDDDSNIYLRETIDAFVLTLDSALLRMALLTIRSTMFAAASSP